MAYQTSSTHHNAGSVFHGFLAGLRGFLSSVGTALIVSSSYNARAERVQALQAKTDEELAALNIKRDEIVHHVFRDLYYV
ncbi:hypothetical protein [uncultured Roseobacter sp.]|uniref:hypothetical protein n=1 Tax=uncultured Roseobacter sp. TaxID=114847 RepID=UPI002620EFE6|nr:hypothetical protein [uncultured Roseobacter sp.]